MGRIIAIDYGLKRTGLAWTDPLQIIATGLETVETNRFDSWLKEVMEREEIESILLGFPTRLNGEENVMTEKVRKLKAKLERGYPHVPVILWDERLTSKMAARALVEAGVPRKKRQNKGLLDQVSATLMLQEYLGGRS